MIVPLFLEQLLMTLVGIVDVLFGMVLNMGVIGVAFAMALDWSVRGLILLLRQRSDKWKSFRVI